MAITIAAPIAYLCFLVGSLYTFSKIQKRRKAIQPVAVPWFPQHKSRDIYISLLSLEPTPARPILVAALLHRAMEDVKLIWSIRDAKTSLGVLHERGQIGDDLWERFTLAEKELEAEIVEVVGEANTFQEGYGNMIFGIASDMVNHEKWKDIYEGINTARDAEKAKMAKGPTSQVLAPYSYLSPNSLSLQQSNPTPVIEPPTTSPAPAPFAALAPPTTPAPFATLPSAPPSRMVTPLPNAAALTTNATKALPLSPPKSPSPAPATLAPISAAPSTPVKNPLSPSGTPATTPGGGSNKKKNKKKKGKAPPLPGAGGAETEEVQEGGGDE